MKMHSIHPKKSHIMSWCAVIFRSSDVGQREQEKSRLEKQYQESDRRLDNLIQGSDKRDLTVFVCLLVFWS